MSEHIESDIDFLIDDVTGAITGHMSGGAGPSKRVGIPTTPKGCTSPYILSQSGIPVILSSSATAITSTGAVSGATALPYVPTGVVQVFMFLAALGGANQLYYARYSSATAFQLYLDAAGTITPTGLTAGAYAGGTSEVTLVSALIPGGAMGANGSLTRHVLMQFSSSASTKVLRASLGGALPAQGYGATNSAGVVVLFTVFNCASQSIQRAINGSDGMTSAAGINAAVDTSIDQSATLTGQLSSAADYMMISSYNYLIRPSA